MEQTDRLSKALTLVFYALWIIIGVIVLGFLLYLLIKGPTEVLSTAAPLINTVENSSSSTTKQPTSKLDQQFQALTPAQKDCVKGALGDTRFSEIENGSTPTTEDLQKGKMCVK